MRRWMMNAVLAAGVLAAPTANAELRCNNEAERSLFEIAALRSELMVVATGCNEAQRYNAFMRKFQPNLQANERDVSAYFKRKYGRSGQTEHDRFVTDLANARSRMGSQLGTDFCPRNSMMFAEVLALSNPADLTAYAAAKDLIPQTMDVCLDHPVTAQAQHTPPGRSTAKR